MDREALLAQMAGPSRADRIGQRASDVASFVGRVSPAAMGVGVGGEILGGLLKPRVDAPTMGGPFAAYVDQYRRRFEGSGDGVAGGAAKWAGRGAQIGSVVPGVGTALGAGIGAVAGAIANLFTKNAASAYSDFAVDDARQAIRDIYRHEGGRDVSDAEIDTILRGQGWEPGDRWVGEKGLFGTLANLRRNFQAERQTGPAPARAGAGGSRSIEDVMARAQQLRGLDRSALLALLGRG